MRNSETLLFCYLKINTLGRVISLHEQIFMQKTTYFMHKQTQTTELWKTVYKSTNEINLITGYGENSGL
jgi:hypothetical protein